MLKNKTTGQDRQCLPVDRLRINRDNRHAKEISDRRQELLLVDAAGIEHLRRPRTAVLICGKLRRFLARRHAARHEKIDKGLANGGVHAEL